MSHGELIPCPFCGGTRAPEVSDVGECEECANFDGCLHRQKNHTCEGCDEWERPMFVVCNYNISGCGASGPYRKTKAEAIAAWNTRHERTCHADEVTHRDCKYSVNRGWRERTCCIVKTWSDSDYVDDWNYRCSECRGFIPINERDPETGDVVSAANYCPNCGAKVVDR